MTGNAQAMKRFYDKSWLLIRYLTLRTLQEGLSDKAASLAYTTLLAIVPFLFVIFKILSLFPIFNGVAEQLQAFILQNFVASAARVVSEQLQHFIQNVQTLPNSSIIFLVIIDLFMIYNIHAAFKEIWGTESTYHLSLFYLLYILLLVISPLAFGVVLVSSSLLYKLPFIAKLLDDIQKPFLIILPYVLTLITFTFFNWILPATRVRFLHALLGGLLTTIVFEIAKAVFSLYLSHFSTYKLIYGALAILPIFLVWLYISWLIILLGALVTNYVAVGFPARWKKKFNIDDRNDKEDV